MPAEHPVPPEVAEVATVIAAELGESLRPQLAELAAVLREPTPVRSTPSDRWTAVTWELPADRAERVASARLDGARVTFRNAGAVTIALGPGPEVAPTSSARLDLAAGDTLTLDTRHEVWAVAASTGAVLAVLTEEWDL
jgi:hypothetical protein